MVYIFFRIQITAELNNLVVKFSEHYHDAWARRKLDNGWKYGEQYNWNDKIHPRVKPYTKLTEYVRNLLNIVEYLRIYEII